MSPCPLRFQFAAEGGWDVGGSLACLTCAALFARASSLTPAFLMGIPMVLAQMRLLMASYQKAGRAHSKESTLKPASLSIPGQLGVWQDYG